MTRTRPPWPAISVASTAAVAAAAATGGSSTVRTLLVVWFLLTCPGMVLARLVDLDGVFEEASVGIGLSLAINLVVALSLVYVGVWSAGAVFGTVAAVTVGAALIALAHRRRQFT